MKKQPLLVVIMIMMLTFSVSCKESAGEKLEEQLEEKSDNLESRSDDLEDASDYVEEAVDDMEDALENFENALEEVNNDEDRARIRKRIIEILDAHDMKFRKDKIE